MNQHFDKARDAFLNVLSACVHHTPFNNPSLSFDEWRAVITLARAHNVLALVFEKASEDDNFTELPEYQQLAFETMSVVAGQARRTEVFLSLYKQFLKEGIHPILMKGLICRQLYGEYCDHRPSGDEDILIRNSDYKTVFHILEQNGYVPEEKYKNVTEAQLNELHEIVFSSCHTGLSVEVHVNPIGKESSLREQLNNCFDNVFYDYIEEMIDGIPIRTMNYTNHLLFLVLHFFKHLTGGGFGIRQVIDILLYTEAYGEQCNWAYLHDVLSKLNADLFMIDLFNIGNRYLGFHISISSNPNCPDELLKEILDCGIFGNTTQAQRTAIQMTGAAIQGKSTEHNSKIKTFLYTIFPNMAWMKAIHPELEEKPWLLPVCWVKRWGRFLAHNKANGGNLAAESMKISKRRIELLKKYDIL